MKKMMMAPLLACMMAFTSVGAYAQAVDSSQPDALIKTVTTEVMNEAKSDSSVQSGDIGRITQLVNQKILPYTDFERTTQLTMGRYWRQATPAQRQQVTEQFKTLLIRTYSGAIAQIRNQTVQYLPFRGQDGASDAVVRTQVNNNGQPVELDYRLTKTAQGWRVYDINVLGAWLIQAYQQQFAQQIQQNGIDGLIRFLTTRNQQLANGNG
ncbi:MlaC/ttg2D family ABC transporter substrate-binding protein [Chitinasiproducens palmae]|uniref:Phospholipid transport system substrate-binding protein n=1 Tax=Chitinasiproducens palmae TaxID=1770053 RepID=A0A1H2PVE6_9BURK|nr:ABC transporter substrate-binding protein [Chitinasiproducens palmae]SDV51290.1 phospholipid transport system substrate-binding protein [Chitinasiproducens palmae]